MTSGWNLWVWLECIVWLVGGVVRSHPNQTHANYS